MAVVKSNGQLFYASVEFEYMGPGGSFDIGIGVKYTPYPTWAFTTVTLPPCAEHKWFSVSVQGVWNTDLGGGRKVDVLKFFQHAGGSRNISGTGFIEADWDGDVYVTA